MKRRGFLLAIALAGLLPAQNRLRPGHPALAGKPKVEIKGKIQRVDMTPGRGMPAILVESGSGTQRVVLGSMRYLIEQDFSPKAGDNVSVTGLRDGEDVYAVTVATDQRTIKVRQEDGTPAWTGRARHGGQGRRRGAPSGNTSR